MSNDNLHGTLSPSAARRWAWCAGSIKLQEQALRETPSLGDDTPHSQHGDGFHTYFAEVFDNRLAPEQLIGKRYNANFIVGQEDADRTQVLLDIIQTELLRLDDPMGFVMSEVKVPCGAAFGGDDECDGIADLLIVAPSRRAVVVIDIKYGVIQHQVEGHPQTILYLLGAMFEFKFFDGKPVNELRTGIYQPRTSAGESKEPMKWANYLMSDLSQWIEFFRSAAERTNYERPVFSPSDETCQWCKAKGICTAYERFAFKDGLDDERALEEAETGSDLADSFAGIDPTTASLERLSKFLDSEPAMLAMYKSAKKAALDRARNGEEIPGYKTISYQGKRAYKLKGPEVIRMMRSWGFTKKESIKEKPIPLTEVQALIKKKGLESELMDNFNKQLITRPDPILILVPNTDPRPATTIVEVMFGDETFEEKSNA